MGEWGLWRFGDGHLLDALKAIDVTPEMIDFVLPTHLHADHMGWNTRPSEKGPVPTFPNARYLFQKEDWDHFTAPAFLNDPAPRNPSQAAMIRNAVLPLEHTGLMEIIGPEYKVTDEVTLLHTPGHTPGSITVLVQSRDQAALLIGDAAHHPAELTEPDWSPVADIDPSLSARSRRAIVDEARKRNAHIGGSHFPEGAPFFGRIQEIEGRMIWRGVTL
ncbi:MAG: N-acyl homoserine lactonase AiiA [Nitrospira sp.]|nr:N-acyl homoserine lactonase AiiA [Nitrospira sp.]